MRNDKRRIVFACLDQVTQLAVVVEGNLESAVRAAFEGLMPLTCMEDTLSDWDSSTTTAPSLEVSH